MIGVGEGENFVASDATPIVEHTQRVIYLNDDDLAVIRKDEMVIKAIRNKSHEPDIREVDLKIGEIDKEGYPHFMLKEIFEQPKAIHDTFRGRVLPNSSGLMLGGLHNVFDTMASAERILIVACGMPGLSANISLKSTAEYPLRWNTPPSSGTVIPSSRKVTSCLQ